MPKVFIVGMDFLIGNMFLKNGWEVVDDPSEADLLQFTGGEDVDPNFYGQYKHPMTYSYPERDIREFEIFDDNITKPKAGICRGGQFLNVASGGEMWQDCNNHAIRYTHKALYDGNLYDVTSTHHQMMKPSEQGEVFLLARESSFRETDVTREELKRKDYVDVEGVFYETTNSLCYQPHPEYVKPEHDCCVLYFNLINKYFGL